MIVWMLTASPQSPPRGLAALLDAHPNHVPAIINGKCLTEDGKKLMIPKGATVQSFLALLRNRHLLLDEDSKRARFVIVDSLLPANSTTFGQLYQQSVEDVLKVAICEESTYGSYCV